MGTIRDMLNSPEMEQLRKDMAEAKDRYEKEASGVWDKLSYDEQLMAFYYVVSKIYKADVIDRGSYRYCLYEIFGFEMDAYVLGMDAGYLNLHNIIYDGVEFEKIQQANKITIGNNTLAVGSDKKFKFEYDEETKELVIKTVDLNEWEL